MSSFLLGLFAGMPIWSFLGAMIIAIFSATRIRNFEADLKRLTLRYDQDLAATRDEVTLWRDLALDGNREEVAA